MENIVKDDMTNIHIIGLERVLFLESEQLRLLAIVSFIFYNVQAVEYSRKILKDFTRVKLSIVLTTLINTVLLFAGHSIGVPLPVMYLLAFFVLFTEFKFFSQSSFRQLLFGASIFLLHIVLINITVSVVLAMITDNTLYLTIYGDESLYYLTIAITFLICSLFLIFFKQFVKVEQIIILSNDTYATIFINVVSCFMNFYLLFDSILFTIKIRFPMEMMFLLSTVAVSGIVFYLCLVHCIKISKLSHFKTKFYRLSQELHEKVEMEKQLRNIAFKDHLTGCYTRTYALDFLGTLIQSKEIDFAVVYIDMDKLKAVNDSYGHGEGDQYIRSVSEAVFSNIRSCDVLARMGGDEFLLILPGSEEQGAHSVMDRALSQIQGDAKKKDLPYLPNLSYGVVCVSKNDELSIKELLEIADSRMYIHKRLKIAANHNEEASLAGGVINE